MKPLVFFWNRQECVKNRRLRGVDSCSGSRILRLFIGGFSTTCQEWQGWHPSDAILLILADLGTPYVIHWRFLHRRQEMREFLRNSSHFFAFPRDSFRIRHWDSKEFQGIPWNSLDSCEIHSEIICTRHRNVRNSRNSCHFCHFCKHIVGFIGGFGRNGTKCHFLHQPLQNCHSAADHCVHICTQCTHMYTCVHMYTTVHTVYICVHMHHLCAPPPPTTTPASAPPGAGTARHGTARSGTARHAQCKINNPQGIN